MEVGLAEQVFEYLDRIAQNKQKELLPRAVLADLFTFRPKVSGDLTVRAVTADIVRDTNCRVNASGLLVALIGPQRAGEFNREMDRGRVVAKNAFAMSTLRMKKIQDSIGANDIYVYQFLMCAKEFASGDTIEHFGGHMAMVVQIGQKFRIFQSYMERYTLEEAPHSGKVFTYQEIFSWLRDWQTVLHERAWTPFASKKFYAVTGVWHRNLEGGKFADGNPFDGVTGVFRVDSKKIFTKVLSKFRTLSAPSCLTIRVLSKEDFLLYCKKSGESSAIEIMVVEW